MTPFGLGPEKPVHPMQAPGCDPVTVTWHGRTWPFLATIRWGRRAKKGPKSRASGA